MLTVSGNKITLTRGDTLTLLIALTKGSQTYTPEPTDSIRFAIARGYVGEAAYDLKISATVPNDTLTVIISAEQTKALAYGTYNYDVEITHDDGTVDTVISSTITITGEVK